MPPSKAYFQFIQLQTRMIQFQISKINAVEFLSLAFRLCDTSFAPLLLAISLALLIHSVCTVCVSVTWHADFRIALQQNEIWNPFASIIVIIFNIRSLRILVLVYLIHNNRLQRVKTCWDYILYVFYLSLDLSLEVLSVSHSFSRQITWNQAPVCNIPGISSNWNAAQNAQPLTANKQIERQPTSSH